MKPEELLEFHILKTQAFTHGIYKNAEIKAPDVFVSSTKNFHPEGLYSIGYFGEQGSPERMTRFAFINLKLPVINPIIYHLMTKAKSLYGDILAGIKYAKYNKKLNIFVESEYGEGETGYTFFMKHIKTVTLDETGSTARKTAIDVMATHREELTTTILPILPAGLRDYRVDADGRPSEDEINGMYRKILGNASFIPDRILSPEILDPIRYKIQLTIQEIFLYINDILYGKRGFINKKVIDRRVHGATRNVLTGLQQETSNIDDPKFIDDDTVLLGLYQILKGTQHQASHAIRNFMSPVFNGEDLPFRMVNKKTLHAEEHPFVSKIYRSMMTYDNINKLIDSLLADVQDTLLVYKDSYYALIYEDVDEYMILHDIDELPDGADADLVRPITLLDMFYHSCHGYMSDLVGTVTRHPVLNHGSIFPTKISLKTTSLSHTKYELGVGGVRTGVIARRYPRPETGIFRTVSVNTSKLPLLSADFDGDTVTVIIAYSAEAKKEILDLLATPQHWLDVEGGLLFTGANDFNDLAMKVLTAPAE